MKLREKLGIIYNGLITENPVLRLVLGTCPTLAVSVSVSGALGMGAASTFVLICSGIVISLLRNIIPDKVRIPCYITVIAGFVTVVMMVVEAFLPELDKTLGIYLPLIVVNCIILGRAEMFASKNPVFDSALDGLGMGLGFTAVLVLMASVREIIGAGTWFGIRLIPEGYQIGIMTMTPGGFFTFGVAIAVLTAIMNKKGKKLQLQNPDCGACGSCEGCSGCGGNEEVAK